MSTAASCVTDACRAMDIASAAMQAFNQACVDTDWPRAETARLDFQAAMDAYFDHMAAAHKVMLG